MQDIKSISFIWQLYPIELSKIDIFNPVEIYFFRSNSFFRFSLFVISALANSICGHRAFLTSTYSLFNRFTDLYF